MATNVLLCSEAFVKNNTNIDNNLNGKLIVGAIREAQDIQLREILGDKLLDKIIELVISQEIESESNAIYKKLLIESQYFLAYCAISNVCMLTAVKIGNAGLEQTSDEHLQPLSIDDVYRLQEFYKQKADFYCLRLQNFILENRAKFVELTTNHCHKINSNLYSSASSGLWLGGVRGRAIRRTLKDKYDTNR